MVVEKIFERRRTECMVSWSERQSMQVFAESWAIL
jgi:hypothetical protein